eukprot:Sspe_Gene.45053::Locus_22193_Transcript_1_1_Confidence_1.000_Length_724::g.45053::m.45053
MASSTLPRSRAGCDIVVPPKPLTHPSAPVVHLLPCHLPPAVPPPSKPLVYDVPVVRPPPTELSPPVLKRTARRQSKDLSPPPRSKGLSHTSRSPTLRASPALGPASAPTHTPLSLPSPSLSLRSPPFVAEVVPPQASPPRPRGAGDGDELPSPASPSQRVDVPSGTSSPQAIPQCPRQPIDGNLSPPLSTLCPSRASPFAHPHPSRSPPPPPP